MAAKRLTTEFPPLAIHSFRSIDEASEIIEDLLRALEDLRRDIVLAINNHASTLDFVITGFGSPEGVVTAPVGTLYLRLNGGAGTTLYVKESGVGNTGWVAK